MKSIFQASRRAICWLLSLALILSFLPAGLQKASAAESEDAIVFTFSDSGITVTDAAGNEIADYSAYAKVKGTALTINAPGSYVVTGSCADGSVSVKKSVENVTLTLRDLTLHSNLSAPSSATKAWQASTSSTPRTIRRRMRPVSPRPTSATAAPARWTSPAAVS